MATSLRPAWEGHLRLSLVSCPVRLYSATQNARLSLHRLSKATHNRLRQQMYDEETHEVVDRSDAILGYEYEKGQFVLVDPEEKEALLIESSKTLDIERFVDADGIDPLYWSDPYYMVPDDKFAQEAFAVIREAMVERHVVALARITIAGRERPVAIEPYGEGMRVTRLRSPNEVRKPEEFFGAIPDVDLSKEMLATAGAIIRQKRGRFEPAKLTDRYQDALRQLVEAKARGRKPDLPKPAEPPRDTKVVNLFAELKRSLDEGNRAETEAAPRRSRSTVAKAAAKRSPAHRAKRKSA